MVLKPARSAGQLQQGEGRDSAKKEDLPDDGTGVLRERKKGGKSEKVGDNSRPTWKRENVTDKKSRVPHRLSKTEEKAKGPSRTRPGRANRGKGSPGARGRERRSLEAKFPFRG